MNARTRLKVGNLWIDVLTFAQALDELSSLVESGRGGAVFTPNIDHVVRAETEPRLVEAYAHASLSLVDGTPIVWASHLLGQPLPERISGSDLAMPLLQRAAERGWSVYLLGGPPGVAQAAADALEAKLALRVVGAEGPRIGLEGGGEEERAAVARVAKTKPSLLIVGLGSPKQELFIHRNREALGPVVSLGLGAAVDFLAGRISRAPTWMSRAGLEWSYRLMKEPRRLWRRYLVEDPQFARILLRSLRRPRHERVRWYEPPQDASA